MVIINYFDGKKVISVEVSDEAAEYHKEACREDWRIEKQIQRHEVQFLPQQLENKHNCLFADKFAVNPLDVIVAEEEQKERKKKAYSSNRVAYT